MSFFLNPFTQDFSGSLLLGDRQFFPEWKCPRNSGRGDASVIVWAEGPYNLSGNDPDGNANNVLNIVFALNDQKNWITHPITITANSLAATTPQEVLASLQSDTLFNDFFTANLSPTFNDGTQRLGIQQRKTQLQFKFFIQPGQADTVLKFNARVGIAELPTYFARHTIANRFTYPDGANLLIQLDTLSSAMNAAYVNAAVDGKGVSLNYDASVVQADYQLLAGKSGIFQFEKTTLDVNGRPTEVISYSAGATVGALAKKTTYSYSGTFTTPVQMTEVPYTLTDADLITPT
jgi:hypothetical protein